MSEDRGELFLIDGNSLVYRAFFALPDTLATAQGEPTNAIFGLAAMLVKVFTDYHPRAVLVVWDRGLSGRDKLYPEYKAGRPERPDLLSQQWPQFEPLVETFGYRNVFVPGYEADDVIATLTEQAKRAGVPATVGTGDRDALQLVSDGVTVMTTARGITETRSYDSDAVVERYGITPELVTDFIGLKGDTSDNIPGVPGIGEKTAAQLLQQFGSLEGVLANIDQISGTKRKEKLTEHADNARLSKQLATAERELETGVEIEQETSHEPDLPKLREFFRRFEIREPLKRLERALAEMGGGTAHSSAQATAQETPQTSSQNEAILTASETTLAELSQLPADTTLALAATAPNPPEGELFPRSQEWHFALYLNTGQALTVSSSNPTELLAACSKHQLIAHDAKSLGEVPTKLAHDTLIAAHLLNPLARSYELEELCEQNGIPFTGTTNDATADRAVALWKLSQIQAKSLTELGLDKLFSEVELPLVAVLRSMEKAGLKLDTKRLAEILAVVSSDIEQLEQEIHELAGEKFMVSSPQQLAEVLFNKLNLQHKRKGKTGYSTDARVLQAIRDSHPIIPKIERYRELTKMVSTYLSALPALIDPADGRIHTTFNQTIAATGRLSSTNPNLQNIPIRTPLGQQVRACFVAETGNILTSADYSQVELRILAHIADEQALKEVFRQGGDVHTTTAAEIFGIAPEDLDPGMRSRAKAVNYGIVYGLTAFGLSDRLGIPQGEAQSFIDLYFERFPAVQRFMSETVATGRQDGYVTTLLGRRRPILELASSQHQTVKLGERLAINTVIQGSAADIMKLAMIACEQALNESDLKTRLILQIHDELLLEGPESEAAAARELVAHAMCSAYTLDPPLEVDVASGPDWYSAKG